MSRSTRWVWCCIAIALLAGTAQAHKPSDSYLAITLQDGKLRGQWDIALRDLDLAVGLDADGDGRITWGEVRAQHGPIAAYAAARLQLQADGQPCTVVVGAQQVDEHTDGAYSVLPLALTCPVAAPKTLSLRYTLLADLDPQHRGLLKLTVEGASRSAILGPQAPEQTFTLASINRWQAFADYLRDGVWHIWIGFDHILFLLSLLLPAVGLWTRSLGGRTRSAATGGDESHFVPAFRGVATSTPLKSGRKLGSRPTRFASTSSAAQAPGRRWQPVDRFSQAVVEVLRVVTAFTLAHSITLSLAVLGLVSLPSRVVESSIAASVLLAALNNVWPVFHGRRWMVAFAFGLLHGFGFASVLVDLGLPQGALAVALVGFNVGVELGQLAIVVAFLPLAYALRRSWFYRRAVLVGGSLLIALLAGVWLVERAFDLKLMPF